MSKLTPKVEVWFDLSATGGDVFTLNDDTKGELDQSTYQLAGDVVTDITTYVHQVSWQRGRDRELDEFRTGTLTVRLRNYDGAFLPSELDTDGTAVFGSGNIVPGKRIRLSYGDLPLFDGYVEDWDFAYGTDRSVEAMIEAVDVFGTLARQTIDAHTESANLAGAKIEAVLDRPEIDFGPARDIDTGVFTMQTDQVAQDTNALQYVQLVASSDRGRLFVSRSGLLTFRDRNLQTTDRTPVAFSDDGSVTAVPIAGLEPAYGSELLFTRVTVTPAGGNTQTSDDTTAQAEYGIRTLSLSGLLLQSNADASDVADFLVSTYSEPQMRLERLHVNIDGPFPTPDPMTETATVGSVLGLEIGDLVNVTWTPRGMTTPVTQLEFVEGISGLFDVGGVSSVSLSLSPVLNQIALQLDSATVGQLDQNVLGF